MPDPSSDARVRRDRLWLLRAGLPLLVALYGAPGGLEALAQTPAAEARAARATDTEGRSPLVPVPEELWRGQFRPGPILGDTTWYQADYEPDCNVPYWFDLALEQGTLVTAAGNSLEIWQPSLSTTQPIGELCQPVLGPWRKTDRDFYATTLALSQQGDLAALGLLGGMGLVVVDLIRPDQPRVLYQDENPVDVTAVEIGEVAGREIAYALGSDRSVSLYDLDEVRALRDAGSVCYEQRFERSCSLAVYLGGLRDSASGQILQSIQTLEAAGAGVVLGSPGGPLSLYLVSDASPGSAQPRARHVAWFGQWGWDTELWQSEHDSAGRFRAAVLDGQQVQLFDIDLSAPQRATTMPYPPLMTPGPPAQGGGSILNNDRLRLSRDRGRDYLFVGRTVTRGIGAGAEYLFDVTLLEEPERLSADRLPSDATVSHGTDSPGTDSHGTDHGADFYGKGADQGYWGWYQPQNDTGFRGLAPRAGVVSDRILYRAARSALDSHRIERTGIFSDGFETANLARWSGAASLRGGLPLFRHQF